MQSVAHRSSSSAPSAAPRPINRQNSALFGCNHPNPPNSSQIKHDFCHFSALHGAFVNPQNSRIKMSEISRRKKLLKKFFNYCRCFKYYF